ncbi:MAG: hypothetical protein HKN20_11855 [Gemmatimonadetes bacterium]|nr:hypothetical protein [Gemmatimonadota bacterium]
MGKVVHEGVVAEESAREGDALHAVLRRANAQDKMTLFRNRSREEDARRICIGRIEARKLDMKLVDVEVQFDGNKITFFFTAEKRIDFRELVKDLASTFKTRIELRQIGVRDEAKRLDGVGPCGKRLCCSEYLREFQPITLKMARDQQLALSPNKISGVCGRLMCCLAYERGLYVQALREFPRVGSRIRAGEFEGKIMKADIFSGTILARGEDGEFRVRPDEVTHTLRDGKWNPVRRDGATEAKPAPGAEKKPARPKPAGGKPRDRSDRPPREKGKGGGQRRQRDRGRGGDGGGRKPPGDGPKAKRNG